MLFRGAGAGGWGRCQGAFYKHTLIRVLNEAHQNLCAVEVGFGREQGDQEIFHEALSDQQTHYFHLRL